MIHFNRTIDIISVLLITWSVLYFLVNFAVPDRWILDYPDFYASDVCRDSTQTLTGTRTALFTMEASGVDQIFSVDNPDEAKDRLQWEGRYQKGETTSSWKHTVTEKPGQYYWKVTTLKVKLPLFISKHINNLESNVFNVIDCEIQN